MKRTGKSHRAAFTLIELLMVIAIISILAGMTLMAVSAAKKRAHIAKATTEIRELTKAWNAYWMAFGEWPAELNNVKDAEMRPDKLKYLLGVNDLNLYLFDAGARGSAEGLKDPWGKFYRVDFSQTATPGSDVYESSVAFPLQRRYNYENM
jgi:prepilin-type N-terminal cleavage/methylation domain-containing protein